MHAFLHGCLTMLCLVAATFFLRFHRDTRERLFMMLAAAFAALGFHWALLAGLSIDDEHRPHVYLVRLVAFALILVGIIQKNRRPR